MRPAIAVPEMERGERFGPYTVHEELGEGGMACVHRAERDGWERNGVRAPIALKRLFSELSDDAQFVEGFLQEARLAKLLDHPNIARSYEHGKIDDTYFMAMEYVPGPTLRAVMIQSRTAAGAIPLRIAVEILVQLCDALAHAHDLRDEHGRLLGLVHRDVSPANVILSTSGVVKLIDFGIAKAKFSRVKTQAGIIKGKISYVAPEYTHGRLDHRADLFAVGVIAHEMLAGKRLFDGESQISVVGKVRELPIHPPSYYDVKIPRDLDDVIMLALQRDPDQRWQNATAMRNALANVARQLGGPVTGRELHAWVEWAFAREPWRDSFVGKLVERLETSGAWHTSSDLEILDEDEARATKPIQRVAQAAMIANAHVVPRATVARTDTTRPATPSARVQVAASARPSRARGTRPPAPNDVGGVHVLGAFELAADTIPTVRAEATPIRAITARDNVLDGWAPPTGTALVRPTAPARSTLPFLIVMLVVASAFAVATWLGILPALH